MPEIHGRHSFLTLWFLVAFLSARGSQVNVTVDDSDPSIVYAPPNSWNSSITVCSGCNNPPVVLALQQTYHKGVHAVPLQDADDRTSAAAPTPQPSAPAGDAKPPLDDHAPSTTPIPSSTSLPVHSSAPASAVSAAPPPKEGEEKGGGKPDDDNDADDHDDKSGKNDRRRNLRVARLDDDDPGFVDPPVFAQYNFTGTAVYVFCIQPLGMSAAPAPPSLMNVTFTLDDAPEKPFVLQGSSSGSGFAYQVNAFAQQGLSDGLHVLKFNLGPNSMFILDYIIVTQNVADNSSGLSTSSSAPVQSQLSAPSSAIEDTKKDRASFAGAVAGSLGVLGILCFGTAFSIYRRRLLAARRERLERGTAAPPAPMIGPAPFIPRYFPGTVIPSNPPPYAPSDASSSSSHGSQLAVSEPLLATYADVDSHLDDIAPPSFGVALTAPAVILLSSHDVATPPPRPASWVAGPHTISLPPSIAPGSRTTSLYGTDDDNA
ncbi:hypothetical protein B0H12DRAFT_1114224 [Mycena haematopus]|nr:hypothetical protein B0H12DRAFT_1114224 [Mycena haematopus]